MVVGREMKAVAGQLQVELTAHISIDYLLLRASALMYQPGR